MKTSEVNKVDVDTERVDVEKGISIATRALKWIPSVNKARAGTSFDTRQEPCVRFLAVGGECRPKALETLTLACNWAELSNRSASVRIMTISADDRGSILGCFVLNNQRYDILTEHLKDHFRSLRRNR